MKRCVVSAVVLMSALGLAIPGCTPKSPICNGDLCGKKIKPDRAMFVKTELVVADPMDVPVRSKITVVDFWEVPCKPCIEAMPGWEALWQRMDLTKSVIVGVSLDDDVDTARKAMRDGTVEVSFPMLYDGEARVMDEIYGVGMTRPVTVVIDENGLVMFDSRGYSGDVLSAVSDLLKARGVLK